jgi:hypothetical protein
MSTVKEPVKTPQLKSNQTPSCMKEGSNKYEADGCTMKFDPREPHVTNPKDRARLR